MRWLLRTGKIHSETDSTGNGTEVAVLNETGGRSVKIGIVFLHMKLIYALYRHRVKAVLKIEEMIVPIHLRSARYRHYRP